MLSQRFLILTVGCYATTACALPATASITSVQENPIFYTGSVTPCTENLASQGLCKKTPLTRCIKIIRKTPDEAKCLLMGGATLVENYTGNTKQVSDIREVSLVGLETNACFSFQKDEYNLWRFRGFTHFSGECITPAQTFKCDPSRQGCSEFPLDNERCDSGWSCNKIAVTKKSFMPCNAEMEQKGLCKLSVNSFYGCIAYNNLSKKPLRCDIRLDALFADDKHSSIKREEILFPQQKQTLCFEFPQPPETFKTVKSMAIVCRQFDDLTKPASICDVGKQTCSEETNRTLQIDRENPPSNRGNEK